MSFLTGLRAGGSLGTFTKAWCRQKKGSLVPRCWPRITGARLPLGQVRWQWTSGALLLLAPAGLEGELWGGEQTPRAVEPEGLWRSSGAVPLCCCCWTGRGGREPGRQKHTVEHIPSSPLLDTTGSLQFCPVFPDDISSCQLLPSVSSGPKFSLWKGRFHSFICSSSPSFIHSFILNQSALYKMNE